ncbi:C40 family peptidase [Streptomyces sp. 549]|uniref:C40 family peptidase n=1 Tax=Streptomyces sp. 549 TaxID=3049076 RepID=UPI0024C28B6A|nr:C40 family peptidase [Streptomyces sp. 549]MDK1476466.1 C40 family peptidase [Streptomyces sp. 549]
MAVVALALVASPLAPAAPAPVAVAAPADRPVSELLTQLRTLYRQAGAATQQYNAADSKLKRQRAEVARLTRQLAGARSRLDTERAAAGRLARRQYRGGTDGLTPYLKLLLSRDPEKALAHSHLLNRVADGQALTLRRLTSGERRLDRSAAAARRALERQRRLAERRQERQERVRERMDAVARLLASMDEDDLSRLRALEDEQTADSQRTLLASGALGEDEDSRTPSAEGARAVRYALDQVGKPYRWGAEGPGAFDCSGLTGRAWDRAGRDVPRTSQEQWRSLPRVPLREVRPGDLVVYFEDATHVALYLGDGQVVHAPRPGARVKVSPIAANPVLGAVRPDRAVDPLPAWNRPPLPAGALTGDDTGFNGNADINGNADSSDGDGSGRGGDGSGDGLPAAP